MNRPLFLIFALATLLVASCARKGISDTDRVALTLQFAEASASKVDALSAGDVAGVFAHIDGSGSYAQANHRFVSDASGILAGDPTLYFLDAKQATELLAYLPYVAGQTEVGQVAYATPVDQTSEEHCRKADLLWGRAASTPIQSAVPIHFTHLLSKLIVATSKPIERWAVHDVLTDGKLDAATGVFALGTAKANISATGRSELILAAQTIQTLDFTVGGVEYVFESPTAIVLESGKSHTLNLTLNEQNHTATLTEPVVIRDWVLGNGSGEGKATVNNRFTAYWALPSAGYKNAARAVLHLTPTGGAAQDIEATNFTKVSVDNDGMCTYSFELKDATLAYPYTINGVSFFDGGGNLIQLCSSLLGANVYKSGDYTLGIQASNVLSVIEGRVNSFTEVFGSGAISGGVANQFVLQLLEPQATGYDYTLVKQVKLTADGVVYHFPTIDFTDKSNILVAITKSFAFTAARPAGYPYTVERVELLDGSGAVVGGAAGVFDAEVMVSRGGLVTMQLFRGKAVGLISGTNFVAYGTQGSSDPIFTGLVVDSPVELVYALGRGTPATGQEATAVARAVVMVKTGDGVSHAVTLSPFSMVGTPLAARSSNPINIVSGAGWPVGARFPYQITHVSLFDGSGNALVSGVQLAVGFDVRWNTKVTLSVLPFTFKPGEAGYITKDGDGTGLPAGMMCVGMFGGYDGTQYTKGLYIDKRGTDLSGVNQGTVDDGSMQWKTANTATSGTTSEYDGKANTAAMIAAGAAAHPAAQYCNSKGMYLPALRQLKDGIYPAQVANILTAEYALGAYYYWSATENNATNAWYVYFNNGNAYYSNKAYTNSIVRCVREG